MPSVSLKDARGPLALALDIGSSSVRALCFDLDGRSVAGSECQIAYALAVTGDGGVTADAPALFEIARSCLDGALTKVAATPCAIACVGVSCFWHSLMGVDAAGKPTTPVLMYSDTRSADAVSALRRDYDQRDVHVRTGCVIHSSYWPAKLRWLRATSPRAVARTAHWQSFAEYALARICGAGPTSVSMASATGLLDIRRAVWDPDALEMAGIDVAALLPIAERTEPLGPIRRALAARWPALAAAAWYPALGDGACANVGVGALSRKRIALTVGTSGAMRVAVPAPPGAALTIPEDLWAYRLDRGSVLLGGAITNGGKVAAWLGDLFAASFDGPAMDAAWAMEPDGHGLTFLLFLAGERSPIWNDRATGVVAGLT
ncbi:MAG: FGGY family carbohydrate kinase, partial [Thermomicrobiales bacterium]